MQKLYRLCAAGFALASVGMGIYMLGRGQALPGCTALASPLFLLLPWLAGVIFGLPRRYGFLLRGLLFAFLACPLGVGLTLYHHLAFYDNFIHLLSGFIFTEAGVYLFWRLDRTCPDTVPAGAVLSCGFGVCFSALTALLWELCEFAVSLVAPLDPQNVAATGVTDTMVDCIYCLAGTLLAGAWLFWRIKRGDAPNRIQTEEKL